ncbi:hypothetical protein HG530_001455 [Fusarium avenaceum]|nr:hypothetical protein HG530_001455 [Fusarium avenaceum]
MYFNSDGSLSFSGRKDMMVKIRGQRVELAEVERAIITIGSAEQTVVSVPKEGPLANRLTVVLRIKEADESFTASSEPMSCLPSGLSLVRAEGVRELLMKRLPEFTVPTAYVFTKTLPVTASAKVDRVTISKWIQSMSPDMYEKMCIQDPAIDEDDQMWREKEHVLQSILAEVLNLEAGKIKRHDSFLNLRGDSVAAMTVVSNSRKQTIILTVRDVLRCNLA